MSSQIAVLLLAHGTPDRVEDIPEYLRNVTSGRPVSEAVIQEVTHRYSLIGRSPLTALTLRQSELLQKELSLPVYVGMRNWHPYIPDTVRKMREAGVRQIVAICMAPQNSRTSVGLYKQRTLAEAGQMKIQFVEEWHDHPQLVQAFAEKLKPAYDAAREQLGTKPAVLFTAHSVPSRTIEAGDPYDRQAKETAALIARQAGISDDRWHFAFQSQGMSGGPWIGPTVEDTITALRQHGHKGVLIQTVGFVCDHVEVLYDIDIAFKQFASEQGMQLWRAPSLNDSRLLISALADLVRSRMHSFSSTVCKAEA
ncbi:MAG TPA: ferrochelatase [Terriglobales bacterium]